MSNDAVFCEVCELPHRLGTERCERCQHFLGTPADLRVLADRKSQQGLNAWLSVGALCLMIVLNIALFRGMVFFVFFAPIGWFAWSVYRYRTLARHIARITKSGAHQHSQ